MKRLVLIILVCFGTNVIAGNIPIHYVSPAKNSNKLLSENATNLLKTRTIHFLANNGISGEGGFSDIVCYPVVNLISKDEVTGMKDLYLYTLEIQLIIKEVKSNNIYGSHLISVKGDGYEEQTAVRNAIKKANFNNEEGKEFIEGVKSKILTYYRENCGRFLKDAQTAYSLGDYNKAIAICYSIPEATECYSKALDLSLSIYKDLQENKCKKTMTEVESEIVNRNYSNALSLLSTIDPSTSCYSEVDDKFKFIDQKILALEEAERKRLEEERKLAYEKYKDEIALENKRIDAITEIAVAYYSNQPDIYSYNIVAY